MDFEAIQYRISESDETAFRELFEHFFSGLTSYATSMLKSRHLAEEVVTDVFVKIWERREDIQEINKITTYLYQAVKYASISALEKQNRFNSISFNEIGDSFQFSYLPEETTSVINKENCMKISLAINQLPSKCQLIFRLIKEEGMKYKEVAQLLELSEKTVENQMNIAIKKLIEILKSDFPEFSNYFSSRTK